MIIVAGDVRIKEMLHKRLPAATAALVRDAPGGGRSADEARIETLLVHDDPASERATYFVGDEPKVVALDRQMPSDLGHEAARAGRLIDVAIRTAVLTGAGIRIVPGTHPVNEGIGAILR